MTDVYDQMIIDVSRFCAVAQMAELGVADQLADGPLDLPEIAEGVIDRCDLVAGDFFAEVPAGRDAYLLANIIHNWGDRLARAILATVRKAMPDHGRFLIVEQILPDDDTPHPALATAVRMTALFGDGAERTRGEYADLLGESGFEMGRVVELIGGTSLIEARPVGGR